MAISIRTPSLLSLHTASWKIISSNSDGNRDASDEKFWYAEDFSLGARLWPLSEDFATPRTDGPIFSAPSIVLTGAADGDDP